MLKTCSIDDLPKYSPWPARLLGLDPWTIREKTKDAVWREYNDEKWTPLLAQVQWMESEGHLITVESIDKLFLSDATTVEPRSFSFRDGGEHLVLMRRDSAWSMYLYTVSRCIAQCLSEISLQRYFAGEPPTIKPSALVELGAGYGSVIFNLMQDRLRCGLDPSTPILAAEFTDAGQELLRLLGKGYPRGIGWVDFTSEDFTDLSIPENAVIFTSGAAIYVPTLPDTFVERLIALKPHLVLHFESAWPTLGSSDLLSLMRKRYLQINDYNRNLWPLLGRFEKNNHIQIVAERLNLFGMNPLLPYSLIAWRPT